MDNILEKAVEVSPQDSRDFTSYNEGDVYLSFHKKIKEIIFKSENAFVFLDEKYSVKQAYNYQGDSLAYITKNNDIFSQVTYLEIISELYLLNNEIHMFRSLLGEAVARLIGHLDADAARVFLKKAEDFI